MATSVLIPIRCKKCGRLYHVPQSSLEQRAKCRPCGHEFDLPRAEDSSPNFTRTTSAQRNAPQDQRVAKQVAALIARQRHPRFSRRQLLVALSTVSLVGSLLLVVAIVWHSRQTAIAESFQRGDLQHLLPAHESPDFLSIVELVQAVEPSIVQLESEYGCGSGFVLDESGLVVTCQHCLELPGELYVRFADGRREKVLGVKGVCPDHDVAIVRISTLRPVKALPLESRSLQKGEPVVVFGAPQGLSFSVSQGALSALRTGKELIEILRQRPYDGQGKHCFDLAPDTSILQITAAAMPGSSGGPAVNLSGNVVGICSFLLRRDGQQFGFCIGADEIRLVAEGVSSPASTEFD